MVSWFEAGSDLKVSLLHSSFHGPGRHYSGCQGQEAIKQSYPLAVPMNHDNNQHGKICIKVQPV